MLAEPPSHKVVYLPSRQKHSYLLRCLYLEGDSKNVVGLSCGRQHKGKTQIKIIGKVLRKEKLSRCGLLHVCLSTYKMWVEET